MSNLDFRFRLCLFKNWVPILTNLVILNNGLNRMNDITGSIILKGTYNRHSRDFPINAQYEKSHLLNFSSLEIFTIL